LLELLCTAAVATRTSDDLYAEIGSDFCTLFF